MVIAVGVFFGGLITIVYLMIKNPAFFEGMTFSWKLFIVLAILAIYKITSMITEKNRIKEAEKRRKFVKKMTDFDKKMEEREGRFQ